MARIGWTAAAVVGSEPESWYRLMIFDDGWVELPAAGRSAARVRGDLRRLLVPLAAIVVIFLLVQLVPHLGLNEMWSRIVATVAGISLLVVLIIAAVGQLRRTIGRFADGRADREQLRRERAAKGPLRLTPGSPRLRRASSAAELASWLTPVHLTLASDVVQLTLTTDGEDEVAVIRLAEGTARAYRTPDRTLHKHLSRVAVAPGVLEQLA